MRAMIYNTSYVVNDKNNKLKIELENIEPYNIELTLSAYTLYTFREHVEERLNTQTLSGIWEFLQMKYL